MLRFLTEDDDTDVVGLQVEGHALEAGAELHHLLGLDVLEAVDTGDTVTDGEDAAGLLQVGLGGGAKDPLLEDGGDLGGAGAGLGHRGGGELLGHDGHGGGLLGHLKESITKPLMPMKSTNENEMRLPLMAQNDLG